MKKTAHNRTRAARLLGITRRTLSYRIRKYGLEDEIGAARTGEENPSRRARPVRVDGTQGARRSA